MMSFLSNLRFFEWIKSDAADATRRRMYKSDLHSTMDRFEGLRKDSRWVFKSDLHSTMDRFEGEKHLLKFVADRDLHSTMDRFEGYNSTHYSYDVLLFTFHYG